ncbi:FMN-dependent NADH-azoreductase [Paenibacillus wenxiniae]|uniref:FMN dependent NADH:quinone oxidoreductase n=1 Tax=Paenibacillus wenxiniae TaxID=1636843 RepID=A0ABW4RMD4_9BACL
MATLLYITAHPGEAPTSYSLAVGEQFVQAYKHAHPADEIKHLDLYDADIPHIDAEVLEAWGKLGQGIAAADLTVSQQDKMTKLGQILNQFMTADKYVFVNPMWNFSYPPVMKTYIDAICMRGQTFKYTENGPVGLLQNKKALHIQASGGIYAEGPMQHMENGNRHLKNVLGFIGVHDVESILIEGISYTPARAPEIKQQAIEAARQLAQTF